MPGVAEMLGNEAQGSLPSPPMPRNSKGSGGPKWTAAAVVLNEIDFPIARRL
jgi:hypothetical protein